jgi:formiminotetrahydrofolate cyclodeaminase
MSLTPLHHIKKVYITPEKETEEISLTDIMNKLNELESKIDQLIEKDKGVHQIIEKKNEEVSGV